MALKVGYEVIAKSSIFKLADAEAAFHPWWETLQDYISYGIIFVGKPMHILL